MNKKLINNYFYSVLYQMLLVLIPLLITPYTTRVLGLTSLSINTGTANVVQWFALFGIMGINTYGNREIARVRDNKEKCSRTFFEIFTMQGVSLGITILFFLGYLFLVGDQYIEILIIQGVALIGVALDITWFFYGVEDFKKVSLRNCFVKVIGVLLIFLLIKKPEDLALFVTINVSVAVIGQLVMWFQLREYIQFEKVTFSGVWRHVVPNIRFFIPQLAISVYSIMDVTMLKQIGPVYEEIYLYEQTQRFIKMFLFFITSIGTVMLPRLSNIYGKNNIKLIQSYLNKTLRVSIYLAIPMILGIYAVIQGFVDWFLPADFAVVGELIRWGSPLILFISLSNVFGVQFLLPTGDTKNYTRSVLIGACVNFVLNFIFIPLYGVFGALLASVLGEMSVTLFQWLIVRKLIDFSLEKKELIIVAGSAVIMMFIAMGVGALATPSFVLTCLQGILGVATYVGLLYVFKAPLFIEVLERKSKIQPE